MDAQLTPGLQTLPYTPPCRRSINTCAVQHQLQSSGILNPPSASQSSEAPSSYISATIKLSDIKVSTNKQAKVPRSGSQAAGVRPNPIHKEFSYNKPPPEKTLKPLSSSAAVGFGYPWKQVSYSPAPRLSLLVQTQTKRSAQESSTPQHHSNRKDTASSQDMMV